MLDIPSISAIVAAIGVLVGVVLTVLELRHLVKQRQTDLILRLSPVSGLSYRELRGAGNILMTLEYKDYNDFVKRYGSFFSGKPEPEAIAMLCNYMEIIGILQKRKLLSSEIVRDFFGDMAYGETKIMPLIEGFRKEANMPDMYEFCEYLFGEMKKREQKLQQSKVRQMACP
jgi:hypothetical protein